MAARVRVWAMAAALGVLAACGGGVTDIRSGGSSAVMVPRFGDADPVSWPGRAPEAYPVHGIDVSRFQPPIDWAAARDAGVSFAFIKATEGGDRFDPGFAGHTRGAAAAGVPWGAYHFFYFCTSAEAQARWFIQNVPRSPGMLPPVLDMEWNPFSPTCATYRPPPEVVRAEMRTFLDIVGRHYGQRPVIYTDPAFFAENGLGQFAGEDMWLRATAAHPSDRYGVQGWRFWQYSATGLVPGISGEVDLNAFGGGLAEWRAWVAQRAL